MLNLIDVHKVEFRSKIGLLLEFSLSVFNEFS